MNDKFTDTELEQEQWRDVDGYDGMYQVSDLGRVRSLKFGKVRVLRPQKDNGGYLSVHFYKDSIAKYFLVHRLVAQAFIPNSDESKTQINHRNEDKTENKVSNLEWCTPKYNANYNDVQFRKKNSKRRKIEKLYRPELSYKEIYKIFKANGIECSENTVIQLRKDLGLTKQHELKRHKLKDLYRPDLSINENISLFKENGIECSRCTIWRIRKDLGLIK